MDLNVTNVNGVIRNRFNLRNIPNNIPINEFLPVNSDLNTLSEKLYEMFGARIKKINPTHTITTIYALLKQSRNG